MNPMPRSDSATEPQDQRRPASQSQFERRFERRPPAVASRMTAVSTCITVIGVAVAAAYASTKSSDKGVGIAAWVAVSVVGASAVIPAVNTVDHGRPDENSAGKQHKDHED